MKGANMSIQRNNLWVLAVAFTVLFNFGCSDEQAAAPNGKPGAQEDEKERIGRLPMNTAMKRLRKTTKGKLANG
jgi:hypothetical protein